MSITDELKAWLDTGKVHWFGRRPEIEPMLDRIDAKHEKAVAGCIHYDPERHYCAVHGDTENGWVKLPVDADGVSIHVGDVVIAQLLFGGESKPLMVDRMELSRGRDGNLWCVALDNDKECWNQPSMLHHHHPPTVEDVLQAMLEQAVGYSDAHTTVALNTIAEYAAKLRLKEDA